MTHPLRNWRAFAGIVSALGWRFGLLWWFPLAAFVLSALWARLTLGQWEIWPGTFRQHDGAATLFMYLTLLQAPLLWLRTRYVLSLGHRRGQVYLVMAAVTLLLPVAQVLVNAAAIQVEVLALGGEQGVLVTGTGEGCCTEPGPPPLISLASFYVLSLGPLVAAVLSLTAIGWMRWGIVGSVAAFAVAAVAAWVALTTDHLPGWGFTAWLGVAACLLIALGWIAFRRQSV